MRRILIVEDDVEINKLLSEFLSGKGYETVNLYQGLHVSECLRQKKVDLVLLDLMLPSLFLFSICECGYFCHFTEIV